MLPGPIFNVELLTSARRARYFLVRAAYAAVLLVLALVFLHPVRWIGVEHNNARRWIEFGGASIQPAARRPAARR